MEFTRVVKQCILLQRSASIKKILKQFQNSQILHHNHNDARTPGKLAEHQKELMSRGLPKMKPIDGVKNIFLVVSGKGGVGKSTTAVNTAVALAEINGLNIGLLDADVFGPSIPLMMGVNESPALREETSAVIWRGLMVMNALERLIRHVAWENVDYLIVDTPPGTGDTLLSLMQNLPISGVIMVSTPQKAAVQVSRRGATMLQKLSVPIIGIVENMSKVQCPKCNHSIQLFGDYTKELASELNIPLLVSIPLESSISTASDGGIPVVLSNPKSAEAHQYRSIAESIVKFTENKEVSSNG